MNNLILEELEISGTLDGEGEVEIEVHGECLHSNSIWVGRDYALQIVAHLTELLNLPVHTNPISDSQRAVAEVNYLIGKFQIHESDILLIE